MKGAFLLKSAMCLVLLISIIILFGGTFFAGCSEAQQSEEARRVFKLENRDVAEVINADVLQDRYGFGSVWVKVVVDSGQIKGLPEIDLYSPRTGNTAFFQEIIDTVRTWEYSKFGSGTLFLHISIDKPPRIDIDLSRFALDNYDDYTIGVGREQIKDLVKAEGFEDEHISIAELPRTFEPMIEEMSAKDILNTIGLGFQIVFSILFGVLLLTVGVSSVSCLRKRQRVWTRPYLVISGMGPMVGLLGTVWGITAAFGKIKGIEDPGILMRKLSGDINIALSTTIVGLTLGIISVALYYSFEHLKDWSLDKFSQRT